MQDSDLAAREGRPLHEDQALRRNFVAARLPTIASAPMLPSLWAEVSWAGVYCRSAVVMC